MKITDEAVNAAAKAMADSIGHGMREKCLDHARAALTAALSSAGEKEGELSHAAQILETVDDTWFQGDGSEPSPLPTSVDKLEVVVAEFKRIQSEKRGSDYHYSEWLRETASDATRIITEQAGRVAELEREHEKDRLRFSMQQSDLRQAWARAEAAEARNAELVKALEVSRQALAKLVSAGHNSPSATPEEIDAAFWSADAALGGQSNEA